ncbi:unnamed protein product [Effrenium voratum]|nr:unnamed protein product [Effrenium voratum]
MVGANGDGELSASQRGRQLHSVSQLPEGQAALNRAGTTPRTRSRSREFEPNVSDPPGLLPSERQAEEVKITEIKRLVEEELKGFLPPDAIKCIKKSSLELAAKIQQLQKTNARISKLDGDLKALAEGRIPNGSKPFPVPFETPLWDSVRPSAESLGWTVNFPEGSTLRACREHLYRAFLEKMRSFDLILARQQREELRLLTKKTTFVDKCLQTRSARSSLWQELDLDVDEDEVDLQTMSETSLTAKATVIYKRTVEKAASALKAKKDLQIRKDQQKDKMVNSLLQTSPQDFLNQAIDQRIAVSKAKAKPVSKKMPRKPPGLNVDAAAAFVSAAADANMSKESLEAFVQESAPSRWGSQGKSSGKGSGMTTWKGKGPPGHAGKGKKGDWYGKGVANPKGNRNKSGKGHGGKSGGKGKNQGKLNSVFSFGRKGKGKGESAGKQRKGKSKGFQWDA